MINRIRAVTRKIPGTNEVRTLMRYDTHAARIAQGVPLFVTLSPDEKHNLFFIRMCRTRTNDPAQAADDDTQHWSQRETPSFHNNLDQTFCVNLDQLREKVPDFDTRRKMISREALASVDGFRTIVALFFEFMLGLRFCPDCPD